VQNNKTKKVEAIKRLSANKHQQIMSVDGEKAFFIDIWRLDANGQV